ncbi:uncharacterized protein BO95DRAFT_462328 [Aspergillus brunneoviolaceus CBS 621.78]|uniref:Uncharacterized protein n=1 Tax=Aspergillus brunneoviolaceus CBS 621.78 TaxID=1450534 RepID=A0ACD1GDH9_9EURO|nr:hypothetical protein BO95DRAFT_462328 [Aspergillus brunneoviolaceus CBS 621.78]RAH47301.1 hypothetical protein BO95DRAFT_462328 [Aspergillus brunneoviolaceus CBS 621.78]
MNRYTIEAENRSGANTKYAVMMMDAPEFTAGQELWLNNWYTTFVPFISVETGEDFYACTFDMKIIESFSTIQEMELSATTGSYEVKTGTDFSMPKNRGRVAPVGSVAPHSNQCLQVTPKMRFFATESQQVPGEIFDRSAVERDGAVVDFSSGEGAGKFHATATQNQNGRFTVKYFDSPE